MTSVNPLDVRLRPATARDEAFLLDLHARNRHWEFADLLERGQEELYHQLVRQQYDAQHSQYFDAYDVARYCIVEHLERPVGKFYADYRDAEVRILDFAILPDYRGGGIAEIVLRGVCLEAALRKDPVPVTVHVNKLNRAGELYTQFGFRAVEDVGWGYLLAWTHPDPEALLRGEVGPSAGMAQG